MNINNLRKRAKALGLVITKTTDEYDARVYGNHRYIMHRPDESIDDMYDAPLWDIEYEIKKLEG